MKVEILGVRVDRVDEAEAKNRAEALLSGRSHYIITPNPEFVVYAQDDPEFRSIINQADLAIADGVGLIWASRFLGKPLPARIPGTNLAKDLVQYAAQSGKSVFFLGGREGVGEAAAGEMKKDYPKLRVVGVWEGEAGEKGDTVARRKVGKGRVDLLLVAFGHPRQEYWIHRNLSKLDVGVAMGIGGAFDFWSGRARRAPEVMQRLGLEWLFRLLTQPWRIKRQVKLINFIGLVLRDKFF